MNPFSAYLVQNPATTLNDLSRTDEALEYACMLICAVCHVSELAATLYKNVRGASSVSGVFISGLNTINAVLCYVFF
jgi:hypothetical protein